MTAEVRDTQIVREVAVNPTSAPLRATSLVRESLVDPTDKPLRVTSLVRESLLKKPVTSWANPTASGSPALAYNVMEIRNGVDLQRQIAGLSAFSWTDPLITSGDRVRAYHLAEMREAIQDLWTAAGLGDLPGWTSARYTDGGVGVGKRVYASDFADVRGWLNYYEGVPVGPAQQGVDTRSYTPQTLGPPPHDPVIITSAWAQDVVDLYPASPPAGPGYCVRCEVVEGLNHAWDRALKESYEAAFNIYQEKGLRLYALLSPGLDGRTDLDRQAAVPPDPPGPIEPELFTNAFITRFIEERAVDAIGDFWAFSKVRDFIIWNEPDATDTRLEPANFAALLYQCWVRTEHPPFLYWGGVMFGPGEGPNPDANSLSYIRQVYEALSIRGLGGPNNWPWSGITIHVHGDRADPQQIPNIFNRVREIMEEKSDPGLLLVGEWGFQVGTADAAKIRSVFDVVKNRTPPNNDKPRADVMFWHSHHEFSAEGAGQWGLRYDDSYEYENGLYVPGDATDLYLPYTTVEQGWLP